MKPELYIFWAFLVFFFRLGRVKAEVQLPDQCLCILQGMSRCETHIPLQKSHWIANAWLWAAHPCDPCSPYQPQGSIPCIPGVLHPVPAWRGLSHPQHFWDLPPDSTATDPTFTIQCFESLRSEKFSKIMKSNLWTASQRACAEDTISASKTGCVRPHKRGFQQKYVFMGMLQRKWGKTCQQQKLYNRPCRSSLLWYSVIINL